MKTAKSKWMSKDGTVDVAALFKDKGVGEWSLGQGLNARLGKTGHGQWYTYVTVGKGKRNKEFLGSTALYSSDDAREKIIKLRRAAKEGTFEQERLVKTGSDIPTFGEFAEQYMKAKLPELKNKNHRAKWASSVRTYCAPIWDKAINLVNRNDIYELLVKDWTRAPVQLSEVRGRIEAILAAATFRGFRTGDNPAKWKNNLDKSGLKKPPKSGQTRGSHKSIKPADMPAFMVDLGRWERRCARLLELTILTVSRTQEAILMRRSWIDLDAALITVPNDVMKMDHGLDHVIPLCPRAVEILREQIASVEEVYGKCDYVWPSEVETKHDTPHIGSDAMLKFLQDDMGVDATVHGMRASFDTWATNQTQDNGVSPLYGENAIAFCQAHVSQNDDVKRAYLRDTMTAQRRIIMNDWARFVLTPPAKAKADNVTPIRKVS